jgi:hypothetical protein
MYNSLRTLLSLAIAAVAVAALPSRQVTALQGTKDALSTSGGTLDTEKTLPKREEFCVWDTSDSTHDTEKTLPKREGICVSDCTEEDYARHPDLELPGAEPWEHIKRLSKL